MAHVGPNAPDDAPDGSAAHGGTPADRDPTVTDPDHYRVVLENDRVRVLEYRDTPGVRTRPHQHPDSVMVTATGFRRRISAGERVAEIELEAGQVRWLPGQQHVGENIGQTPTHAFFVELKEPDPAGARSPAEPDGPPPAPFGPA